MKQILKLLVPATLLLTACATTKSNGEKGLKDYYKDYFDIGVALPARNFSEAETSFLKKHFNSATAENAMKIQPIQPVQNQYNFAPVDSLVAVTRRLNMKMRGHTLCWHNQVPDWFFKNEDGSTIDKATLYDRVKTHIYTVAGRYKNDIYAWDVVNEVISDKKEEFYRPSKFYEIAGPDYIDSAYTWAHEAAPDALLFYNDYNEIDSTKRSKIIQMIRGLQAKNIPVHGIGLQAHWALNEPSESQLEQTLKDFSDLGLNIQITELDMSIYPKEHQSREWDANRDKDTLYTNDIANAQAKKYAMFFKLFRKYRKHISSVTFWNISDKHSWLDDFPVKNRKDYPLLFDKDLQPKKAYDAVIDF